MPVRTLRIWSGIGAAILFAVVILLAVGVALWKPLFCTSVLERWKRQSQ